VYRDLSVHLFLALIQLSATDSLGSEPPAQLKSGERVKQTLPAYVIRRMRPEPVSGQLNAYMAMSPDGQKLVSGSWDWKIRTWNVATGKEVRCWPTECAVHALALSPDGSVLASAGPSGAIQLWDMAKGEKRTRLTGHRDGVTQLAFSSDGTRLVSGDNSGTKLIWDLSTGQQRRRLPGDGVVAFVPHSCIVALANGDTIDLRDSDTGRSVRRVGFGVDEVSVVSSIAFSRDGQFLAASNNGWLGVWETATWRAIFRARADTHWVSDMAFSPDGKMLASGGSDRVILLWEVATGKQRQRFVGAKGGIVSLCFSPEGRVIFSGDTDATLLMWDIIGQAQDRHVQDRRLTPEDLKQLGADLASEDTAKAWQGMCALIRTPRQTADCLQTICLPAPPVNQGRIAQWLVDLDSDSFAVREKATAELRKLEDSAEPAIRRALTEKPSLEVRRRLQILLDCVATSALRPSHLQSSRSIEVLEHIGNSAAQKVLEGVAKGAPEARLTQEAKAALKRLAGRPLASE
jgi:dipeptidyl aminopeptidase/acylaminoacyl peptidase